MADTKISALSATTSAAATDIIPIVLNPGGTPLNYKIAVSDLVTSLMSVVTTGAVSATSPVTFTAARQVLGGTATVAITTGVLTAYAPLNTETVFSILGTSNFLSLTTGILSVNAPLTTSGLTIIPGTARTISFNTAGPYFSGTTIGTLQGILAGTGGTVFSIGSTGAAGQVLSADGDNTYTWTTLTTSSHNAVTIGTANGLSIDASQVLSLTTATVAANGALDTVDFATFSSKMANATTGAVSATAPVTFTASRQVFGGAATVALTTGILSATAPVVTSGLMVIPGSAGSISITTGILNATGPLSTSGLIVVPGSAGSITMTTGLLTPSAPLTTSGTTVIVGTGRTVAITTGILTMSAPLITSGQFTIPTGAATVSMQTATPSTNGYITSTDYNTFERNTKSFVVYAPPGSATYPIWKTPIAITITSANALVSGGTSLTGQLQEADANGANGVTITDSGAIVAGTNTALVISNAGVDANDYILWVTTATSGTPTSLTVSFVYVEV